MTLFVLCEYATLNGGERSLLATLAGVRAAGFSPVVLAPPAGPLADALRSGGSEVIAFAVRDAAGHRPQPRLREELAELLRQRRPRLLHANSLAMGRLCGPVAAAAGVPSIAHLRDIVNLSRQAVADLNAHRRLLAVSRAVRAFHVAGGLCLEKMHVLYNGVDLERFRPRGGSGYLHRELGISPRAALVGTIGQIGPRKGQDILLKAAATLAARLPHVHFVIVGERLSEKAESRRFEAHVRHAAAATLAGRCHFLGRREDVDRLLPELTLLVHPARQEPLGRVLLEAAGSGVPVIATAVGGTAEIFPADSQAARLVPPDDAPALAAAIEDVLGDEPLRRRFALAGRCRAAAAFDIRHAAAALVAHYRAVIDGALRTGSDASDGGEK